MILLAATNFEAVEKKITTFPADKKDMDASFAYDDDNGFILVVRGKYPEIKKREEAIRKSLEEALNFIFPK